MSMEQWAERELAEETEMLREKLPRRHLVQHKSHNLGSNPGRRSGKPATNRLSYDTE
jgi:hypothetical protein